MFAKRYKTTPVFEVIISLETPSEDYCDLIDRYIKSYSVEFDLMLVHDRIDRYINSYSKIYETLVHKYNKIAAVAQETVEKLLFECGPVTEEDAEEIADFLSHIKKDACTYNVKGYNEWIIGVRDKVLEKNLNYFWEEHMVKEDLGIIHMDLYDTAPRAFYNYSGCVAPFAKKDLNIFETSFDFTNDINFHAVISSKTPVEDYKRLMEENVESENITNDDLKIYNYRKIANAARDAVYDQLFKSGPITKEDELKIAELLKKIKEDACFHDPSTYNEWIIYIRKQLFRRSMIDFWRDQMVAKELGPCCATGCLDDMEDPALREFYIYNVRVPPIKTKINKNDFILLETTI